MSAMDGFRLSLAEIGRVGAGLSRPECVLTTACGDLYVSDARGGVARILPDGSVRSYLGRTAEGAPLGANGFAMLPDGSFLIAPLTGGAVYRLHRDGSAEPFVSEADGRALLSPNFVLLDDLERIWICVLAQQDRNTIEAYPRSRRDGFIVLCDRRGARIVAEHVGYPNEVRVDPTGRYLYINESLAARLLRFPIGPGGDLGPVEIVYEFDESNMFDGFTLDSAGGAWITTLISNRLWYVPPRGPAQLIVEDAHPEHLARLTEAQQGAGATRHLLYEDYGSTLRNIASIAFGGPDLRTAYMGNLMGESVFSFRSPVAGMRPAHWNYGSFAVGS